MIIILQINVADTLEALGETNESIDAYHKVPRFNVL